MAGEVLKKFVQYRVQVAIWGIIRGMPERP
ncbi:DUF4180 domain-containing protein [Acetanaerobacterium sp. MSJ-12]|nr:DUF4180 domain-containing protein [Acetanaerobacterium sp. MSJ-12]